ncbi:MAG: potassium transporter Kup [Longimicrobiales bacterium]
MSETKRGERGNRDFWVLSLTALGVVFGDIGTSPIYALRESFHLSHGLVATRENTLGVLSLIFWSLILVISLKYLLLVLRADNRGEGGIIALTALISPPSERARGRRRILALVGLFGAALLYGDSMITPAISVLSAIEGLQVVTPFFQPFIIPITIGILVALFAFQRRGTAGVGAVFGPVTLIWFTALAVLGLIQIWSHPSVLFAVSPHHGAAFFMRNGWRGLLVLGSVFLVVTGGEALYADMGHFGKGPIRFTWTTLVLPSLVLNYFGQGALIIADPGAAEHPFFLMVPSWALVPLVILATAATVIASQAVISGAFSLTRQAVQLGYLPRLRIDHTSEDQIGQIFMPAVNWALMFACIGLVLGFRSSGRLAAAYGVAVTTDMVFTTILFSVVALVRWKWNPWAVGFMTASLLVVDLAFWTGNLPKIPHGGWFPILVAAVMFTLMTTWKRGREILASRFDRERIPVVDFLRSIEKHPPQRVPGTAIFMNGDPGGIPRALLHNLKHNRILHERVLLMTVETEEIPYVSKDDRILVEELGDGFFSVVVLYGFAEDPDVPKVLEQLPLDGYRYKPMETTFFLGQRTFVIPKRPVMARWRSRLFDRMSRNAERASAFFRIPVDRVVELGAHVEL